MVNVPSDNGAGIDAARIRFTAFNIALQRPLSCGPFRLEPHALTDDEQRDLADHFPRAAGIMDGYFTLPPTVPNDDGWDAFFEGKDRLELLLSFAHRSAVAFHSPVWEIRRGGDWEYAGFYSSYGNLMGAKGVDWYVRHERLEEFVRHGFERLGDPVFAASTGLRLALAYFRESRHALPMEISYLSVWTALEILIRRNGQQESRLPRAAFRKVRRQLEAALDALVQAGALTEDEALRTRSQISRLNEASPTHTALRFFESVFRDYPNQDVTEDEFKAFYRLRNQLFHHGTTNSPEDGEYPQRLHHEYMRVSSLLTRVILAMLDQQPNLMRVSWRKAYAGA